MSNHWPRGAYGKVQACLTGHHNARATGLRASRENPAKTAGRPTSTKHPARLAAASHRPTSTATNPGRATTRHPWAGVVRIPARRPPNPAVPPSPQSSPDTTRARPSAAPSLPLPSPQSSPSSPPPRRCPTAASSCPRPRRTSKIAASSSLTSCMSQATPTWTIPPLAPPSSRGCSWPLATRWASSPSPIGATPRASQSSANRAWASSFPRATWTRWSTTTPPTRSAAPPTPTRPAARRVCAPTAP